MAKFRIEFVHEGEEETRTAEVEFAPGFEELTFSPQYLDWEEQYFIQHNEQLIEPKAIVTLEELDGYGVDANTVVWRDWGDLDVATPEGERNARQLLRSFRPAWDDVGPGLDELLEVLSPLEPWERNL